MLQIIDYFGVIIASIAGSLMAGRKQLDLVGVIIVAVIASVGGGTLRDVLLDRPVFWLQQPHTLLVAAITACATFALSYQFAPRQSKRELQPSTNKLSQSLLVADALALGAFNSIGLLAADPEGVSALAVIIMGGVTGVAGGLLRDVVCNELPVVFRGTLYLSCAIAGGIVFVLLRKLGIELSFCVWSAFSVTTALRLVSIRYQWHLPLFELKELQG